MSSDDARGVGEREVLAEALHRITCSDSRCGGADSTDREDADALLASPQFARLIEQREAAARAEGRREVREAVEGICEEATERAYFAISLEEMLTIQCTGEGRAKVPPHWRVAAERRARISPADLRAVLAGQGGEEK